MSPFFERRSSWPAWLGAIVAAAAAAILAALICFELMPAAMTDAYGRALPVTTMNLLAEMTVSGRRSCAPGWVPDVVCWVSTLGAAIAHPAASAALLPRLAIVLGASITAGWIAFDRISMSTPPRD